MWLADLLFARLGRQRYQRILDRVDVEAHRVDEVAWTVKALQRRVASLEIESHGHCTKCGRRTDYPTILQCYPAQNCKPPSKTNEGAA